MSIVFNKVFIIILIIFMMSNIVRAEDSELLFELLGLESPKNIEEAESDYNKHKKDYDNLRLEYTLSSLESDIVIGMEDKYNQMLDETDSLLLELSSELDNLTTKLTKSFSEPIDSLLKLEKEYKEILFQMSKTSENRDAIIHSLENINSDFVDNSKIYSVLEEKQELLKSSKNSMNLAVNYEDIGDITELTHPLFNFLYVLSDVKLNTMELRASEGTRVLSPFNAQIKEIRPESIVFDCGAGILIEISNIVEPIVEKTEFVYQYQIVAFAKGPSIKLLMTINDEEVNIHNIPMKSQIPVSLAKG